MTPARSRWESLFRPRAVAVLGISSRSAAFQIGGRALLDHLVAHGYGGEVFPVSRSQREIAGLCAYPTLADLPRPADCAVIAISGAAVIDATREALARGTRAFVVVSSGFAEAGDAGARLQAELVEVVRSGGGVMLGPNTTGYVNFHDKIALTSTSRAREVLPPAGSVGVIVQSGALGSAVLELAADRRIGLSHLISSGNEASHGVADFIDFLVEDAATRVIALYVEGFKAPAAFLAASERAAAAGKPIVILKSGSTEAGQKAAASHTGALAGSPRVQGAVFRQLGMVVVDALEGLLDTAAILARAGGWRGRRLGIVTVSGGLGSLLADALERGGSTTLPRLADGTRERLRQVLPPFLPVSNPLDNGGIPFREPGQFERTLRDFAADPSLDGVVVAVTPIVPAWAEEMAKAVVDVGAEIRKPIAVLLQAGSFCAGTIRRLRADGVPTFTSVPECAAALTAAARHADAGRDRPAGATRLDALSARRRPGNLDLPSAGALDEAACHALLARYGLGVPRHAVVPDGEDSLREASAVVGFPLVLKALVEGVAHKSELGLVAVGIPDVQALLAAARRQRAAADRAGAFRGFMLTEVVRAEAEVLVGVTFDDQFGPVLTFGAGGVFAEILDDVSLRVLPVAEPALREMVDECRIARVLRGARGGKALDVPALVRFMAGLSELALDVGARLESIEVNPLAVLHEGHGVVALDAKIALRPGTEALRS